MCLIIREIFQKNARSYNLSHPCFAYNRTLFQSAKPYVRCKDMQGIQDPTLLQKQQALARFLNVDPDSLTASRGSLYGYRAFFHGNNEAYLVLTDAEATTAAEHAVSEKLWFICLETMFAYFDIDAYPSDPWADEDSGDPPGK